MEKLKIRNITETVFAYGILLLSAAGNNTCLIDEDFLKSDYLKEYNKPDFQNNRAISKYDNNVYFHNNNDTLSKISTELFGNMRVAADEEKAGIDNYIKKTAKKIEGINFFDIC